MEEKRIQFEMEQRARIDHLKNEAERKAEEIQKTLVCSADNVLLLDLL